MEFVIPEPLQREHQALHDHLRNATQEKGAVGEAARALATLMHPHFIKEDKYALPPLGLLPMLAKGRVAPEMAGVLPLTDRLAADLEEMLDEHKQIVMALNVLADAARRENKPEHVAFAEELARHAEVEEQVMYPAALLVGSFVKAKLGG